MICHTFLLVLSVLEGCCRVAENYFSILKIFLFPISPHQRFKLSYLSKRKASTTHMLGIGTRTSGTLSYLSKRKASTTDNRMSQGSGPRRLSYLSKRKASTTLRSKVNRLLIVVVIPLQTKGFYNIVIGSEAEAYCKLSYLSKRKASTT